MSRPMSQAASRAPSVEGNPNPPSRHQSQSRNRGRSRTPRSLSASSAGSLPPTERKPRRPRRNKGGMPSVEELDDTVADIGGAVEPAGNVSGDVSASGGGDKPLKLRLDLNLDVEVTLKARVHGDLTLGLL